MVRQIVNLRHKITKLARPIFFVDLEPTEINKDIFHIISILYIIIKIEEPPKWREIIQCLNCQKYGYSKSYCSHVPRCVRCFAYHLSSACTKTKDQSPTFTVWGRNHLESYRMFTVHKDLQKFYGGSKTTLKKNIYINLNNLKNILMELLTEDLLS